MGRICQGLRYVNLSRCSLLFFVTFICTILVGCKVGPNFHSPAAPPTNSYEEVPLPKKTVSIPGTGKAGKSQLYVQEEYIPSQWWQLFHSAKINELVKIGIANNQNLSAAYAALRVAQENFNVQVGNSMLPAVNAQLAGQRQLFSGASFGGGLQSSIFNVFNANVNVSYTLDVFGGARRQIESFGAQVDYQQFELIAVYLTLTTNIVNTAVTIASLKDQIKATKELIKEEDYQLNILQKQYRYGGISLTDVLAQQTFIEQTRASLPPLEKSLSANRHALSTLLGGYPDQIYPEIVLDDLHLPPRLPISLPSNLVRQRPDVRAAEALLHSASAQIGVATANLFPQFVVTGNYGWQAAAPAALFGTTSNVWSYGAQITQPIFHGGALLAQRRAAIAAYEQAFAQYKQSVLQGLQNVADSLRALETDARAFKALNASQVAASKNLRLTSQQYYLGGTSYLNLLIAQQQFQQTVIRRIQAQANRYTDTAALFQALGGGWWNKPWCVKECLYEKFN